MTDTSNQELEILKQELGRLFDAGYQKFSRKQLERIEKTGYTKTIPSEPGIYCMHILGKDGQPFPKGNPFFVDWAPYTRCCFLKGNVEIENGVPVMKYFQYDTRCGTRTEESFLLTVDGVSAMMNLWHADTVYFKAMGDLPYEPEYYIPEFVS